MMDIDILHAIIMFKVRALCELFISPVNNAHPMTNQVTHGNTKMWDPLVQTSVSCVDWLGERG